MRSHFPTPDKGFPARWICSLQRGVSARRFGCWGRRSSPRSLCVDPGNFATNVQAGAKYGYLLMWVVLAANLMAMLVQYLSAKLGIVTDQSLPEVIRERSPRAVTWAMWVQAEIMAMSTDVAEFLGAALGLNLLFDVPLLPAGIITGIIAFAILELQSRGFRTASSRDHGSFGTDLRRLSV